MRTFITTAPLNVNFAPATVIEEVVQNVRTIITTMVGTVPLDRDFGLDASFVDSPMAAARALITASLIDKIGKYEPRAKVIAVTYRGDADGKLTPSLEVEINAE